MSDINSNKGMALGLVSNKPLSKTGDEVALKQRLKTENNVSEIYDRVAPEDQKYIFDFPRSLLSLNSILGFIVRSKYFGA